MTTEPERPLFECDDAPCRRYGKGHAVHPISARLIGHEPWGWRDAIITGIDARNVTLVYLIEDAPVRVWHHKDLRSRLEVGEPVRLHERRTALGSPEGWFSVVITDGGLGPVPMPGDPMTWASQMRVGVADYTTGEGIPVDCVRPGRWRDRWMQEASRRKALQREAERLEAEHLEAELDASEPHRTEGAADGQGTSADSADPTGDDPGAEDPRQGDSH